MKDEKPKIAFVVGHSNWGKSRTLRAFTNGSNKVKHIVIGGIDFFIRRMSNDDIIKSKPTRYADWMRKLNPKCKWPHVIATLCPKPDVAKVLKDLAGKGYELFFWVIIEKHDGKRTITQAETQHLHKYGTVEMFLKRAEADVRASAFKEFVSGVVIRGKL